MSNETKHTAGPWETSRDAVPAGHVQITVYADDGQRCPRVATVFIAEANAHLIASAPELLGLVRSLADNRIIGGSGARKYRRLANEAARKLVNKIENSALHKATA